MKKVIGTLILFSFSCHALAELRTCNIKAPHIYAAPIADDGGFLIYKVAVVTKESAPLFKVVRINKTNCAYEEMRVDGGDEIFAAPSFTWATFRECRPGQIGVCPGNHTSRAYCGNDGRWRCQ